MKIRFNEAGFDALRKSPEMCALLEEKGRELAASAGPGYEAEPAFKGRKRARVSVKAATKEAKVAEARQHNLIRALAGMAGTGYVSYTSKSGRTSIITERQAANYASRGG